MRRFMVTMKVGNDIYYVGVNDHQVDLFEGQYDVPNGMAYNSYVIMDEKITVMDTVDAHLTEEWLGNIAKVLDERSHRIWLYSIWNRIMRQISTIL